MRIKVLVGKSFKQSRTAALNAAPVVQRERDRNDGDVQVKVQKSCLFHAQLEKLQQVKLSAVWILAISLTILVYNHY